MKLSLSKIHHIAIKVSDLEKVTAFYRDVLNFKEFERQQDASGQDRSVWLECAGTILMIEKHAGPTDSQSRVLGWHLLAFTISAEERLSWEKYLLEKSVRIHLKSEYSLYFDDPEGNRIALSHYPSKQTD